MAQLDDYWPVWKEILKSPDHCICLYHGVYNRDGVKDTAVVQKVLPLIRSLCQGDDNTFRDFVKRCLPGGNGGFEPPQELALLLRSMIAWREFGETSDDSNRGYHHVNNKYLEGELPTDPEDYIDNDEEGILILMEEARMMWSDGTGPLWAGICVSYNTFSQPTLLWHYCEQRDIHDFYTNEYIKALSDSIKSFSNILEVGAGRGNLSKYLKSYVKNITATDSDDFDNVTQISYEKALKTMNPDLVICSWMPYGEDWTPQFRSTESVRSYILLGPPGVTATPSAWKDSHSGWSSERLEDVEVRAIAKIDCGADPGNSKAVMWTRNTPDATMLSTDRHIQHTIKRRLIIIIIYFMIVIFYLMFGGLAMKQFESGNEDTEYEKFKEFVKTNNVTDDLLKGLSDHGASFPGDAKHWTYTGSVFFCLTVVTTIGYGAFAPVTYPGQVFTVFYAIIGISWIGVLLSNLAQVFAGLFKAIVARNTKSRITVPKHFSGWAVMREGAPQINADALRSVIMAVAEFDPNVWGEHQEMIFRDILSQGLQDQRGHFDKESVLKAITRWFSISETIPEQISYTTIGAFFMMNAVWVFSWAVVFQTIEGWTYTESVWFACITLTTIGFGDYAPVTKNGRIAAFIFIAPGVGMIAALISALSSAAESRRFWVFQKLHHRGSINAKTMKAMGIGTALRLDDDPPDYNDHVDVIMINREESKISNTSTVTAEGLVPPQPLKRTVSELSFQLVEDFEDRLEKSNRSSKSVTEIETPLLEPSKTKLPREKRTREVPKWPGQQQQQLQQSTAPKKRSGTEVSIERENSDRSASSPRGKKTQQQPQTRPRGKSKKSVFGTSGAKTSSPSTDIESLLTTIRGSPLSVRSLAGTKEYSPDVFGV